MINYHYLASSFGSQKLCLPVSEFKLLQCTVGTTVRVTSSEGCFVCKVYPRTEFKDEATVETTVQIYSKFHKIHLRDPILGNLEIVQLPIKTATKLNITVVVKTFSDVCNLKQANCHVLIKGVLANRIFSELSSIHLKDCVTTTGIEKVLILRVQPKCEAFRINAKTQIIVEAVITSKWLEMQEKVSSINVAGIEDVYNILKEHVAFPLQYPDVFSKLHAPKGLLIFGPPGCGKSSIVQQLCSEYGLFLVPVTISDLSSSEPGGSEAKLKTIFHEARSVGHPTVILLDDVDSICPKKGGQTHTDRLIISLTSILDNMRSETGLTIIATTTRLEDVDPSLRRSGRLDKEVSLSVPSLHQREAILQLKCTQLGIVSHCLKQVAELTPGYVGADLDLLCHEVQYMSQDCKHTDIIHWKMGIGQMRPSIMRQSSGSSDFRRVTWDEVGGLEEAKLYIRRSIEWPLKHPEAFDRLNVPRPKGVLIYGPPGCGKSLLARAAATSCAASFLSISAAELFSPFVGDSEKIVSDLFRRARQSVPTILFLDELDAMVGGRSTNQGRTAQLGVIATLLQEMDGVSSSQGIVVVGATNRPDKIDNALLRPGRFDSLVLIPNPDVESRLAILKAISRNMPLMGVDLKKLAEQTELFSGADLESLVKEAALSSLEKDLTTQYVEHQHFEEALQKVTPSLTTQQIEFYREYSSGRSQ